MTCVIGYEKVRGASRGDFEKAEVVRIRQFDIEGKGDDKLTLLFEGAYDCGDVLRGERESLTGENLAVLIEDSIIVENL